MILAHPHASEVMGADQIDRRLDCVESNGAGPPERANQRLEQVAEARLFALEVRVDGSHRACVPQRPGVNPRAPGACESLFLQQNLVLGGFNAHAVVGAAACL